MPSGSAALVYNTRFDGRRPDAVVHVRDTADVAAAVRWANRFDVRLVARSGGHSYGGYSTTADGVVLDLSALRGVRVSGGRATVGPGRPADRRPAGAHAPRRHGAVGVVPDGRHRRPRARRRPRPRRAAASGSRATTWSRRAIVTADGRVRHVDAEHERGPVLGVPRRGRRQLRRRHLAARCARTASRAPRTSSCPGRGPRRARRSPPGSASRRTRRARSPRSCRSAPPAARARRGSPRSASTSAARRRCGGSCGRSRASAGAQPHRPARRATSRWCSAGPAASTAACPACHRSTRSSFYAKSDYFDRPVGPRGRASMIDWIERRQRTPSLGSGRAAPRRLRRRAQPAGRRTRPRSCTATCSSRSSTSPTSAARRPGARAGAGSTASGTRSARTCRARRTRTTSTPTSTTGSGRTTARTSPACATIKKQVDPDFRFRFPQAIPPAR